MCVWNFRDSVRCCVSTQISLSKLIRFGIVWFTIISTVAFIYDSIFPGIVQVSFLVCYELYETVNIF